MAVLLLTVLGLQAGAQTVVARLDLTRRDALPEMVRYCSADHGFVTLARSTARSSRYYSITKFNEAFEREWSKQVFEGNGRNRPDLIAVLGERILFLTTDLSTREDQLVTSYSLYDLSGAEIGTRSTLSKVKDDPSNRSEFEIVTSLNKKVVMAYRNRNTKGAKEEIEYHLFDEERGLFGGGTIQIPFPDDKFQVRAMVVSNQGVPHLLGKQYNSGRINSPDDYEFLLYRVNPSTSALEEHRVDFGEGFVTDLNMKVDKWGNVYFAGFYSEVNASQIIGTLYQRLDSALTVEVSQTTKFDERFLSDFLSDRQIENGRELKNFYLDDIILRSDGGVLMVAERFYITYNSYLDIYGYWVDQKVYHYDEIIVNSLSAEGKLEWSGTVYKRQTGTDPANLSYVHVVSGPDLYLLYQSEPRREPDAIYLNDVSLDGKVSDRSVFTLADKGQSQLIPDQSEQISNTDALLVWYNERDRLYTIARVEF
jgi:hypothetical protein